MFIKGLMLVTASSILAGVASAQPTVLNLQQLQAICHDYENNDQYMPFSSQFTCSEERTFWVKKGSKVIPLLNRSEVKIKALIKGNQHQTDWWTIPGRSEDQATSCDLYEQVRGIARVARTLKSCAELDQITSEQEYCKGLLMPVWDDCARDMNSGNYREGHTGACEYIPTGLVKGCAVAPDTTTTTSTTSTTSVSSVSDTTTTIKVKVKVKEEPSVSSVSTTSASTVTAPLPSAHCPLGSHVKKIKVKKGMFSHSMVALESDPEANSLLAKLNLQKGDVIAKVNGAKVRTEEELDAALRTAKKSGAVTINFRDQRGMFLDRTRAEI